MLDEFLTRRDSLVRLGGFLGIALGLSGWKAASSDGAGVVTCLLTPEQTEGPYYIADEKVRRDITEGRPGTPLLLRAYVVDAASCRPIKGAAVDIWHADASGVYSGFGQGAASRTFMRGIQRTNAKGLAVFRTVYPGWYPGRTVHIHVKVHVRGNVLHTGQLYFPDSVTDTVYRNAPYDARPGRTTRNGDDATYGSGGRRSTVGIRRTRAGVYVATIRMGVRRT